MDCQEAERLIYASVDGSASADDTARLAEHVRDCAACADDLRKLGRLEELLRAAPEPAVSRTRLPGTVEAVASEMGGMGRKAVAPEGATGGAWIYACLAAAMVALVAGVGYMLASRPEPGTDETPRLIAKDDAAKPEPASPATRAADGERLVEKLVQAELALAETTRAGEKAVVFCGMSRDVVAALEASAGVGDDEAARQLGRGFARLVRGGVLPNVRLADANADRERVSRVVSSLKESSETLAALVNEAEGGRKSLFAEALKASEECLMVAEDKLGL